MTDLFERLNEAQKNFGKGFRYDFESRSDYYILNLRFENANAHFSDIVLLYAEETLAEDELPNEAKRVFESFDRVVSKAKQLFQ